MGAMMSMYGDVPDPLSGSRQIVKPSEPNLGGHGSPMYFNRNDGYLEGIVRGWTNDILTDEYVSLNNCENMADFKQQLSTFGKYKEVLANSKDSDLDPTQIREMATAALNKELRYLRCHAAGPAAKFLDFLTYPYMIDNILLVLRGIQNEKNIDELIAKCNPIGLGDDSGDQQDLIRSIVATENPRDLYINVLCELPIGKYFLQNDKLKLDTMFDETGIEVLRATLYTGYIQDFYSFCKSLGAITGEIMGDLLKFEADRWSINIARNTLNVKDLKKDDTDHEAMYPELGFLYPYGRTKLMKANSDKELELAVRGCLLPNAARKVLSYKDMLDRTEQDNKELDMMFKSHQVDLCCHAFSNQFHYGVFYAYLKLREQEIDNLYWIAECIKQQMTDFKAQHIKITF